MTFAWYGAARAINQATLLCLARRVTGWSEERQIMTGVLPVIFLLLFRCDGLLLGAAGAARHHVLYHQQALFFGFPNSWVCPLLLDNPCAGD